jgi:hypothetical protein
MAPTLSTEQCVGQDCHVAVRPVMRDGREVHGGGFPGDG